MNNQLAPTDEDLKAVNNAFGPSHVQRISKNLKATPKQINEWLQKKWIHEDVYGQNIYYTQKIFKK